MKKDNNTTILWVYKAFSKPKGGPTKQSWVYHNKYITFTCKDKSLQLLLKAIQSNQNTHPRIRLSNMTFQPNIRSGTMMRMICWFVSSENLTQYFLWVKKQHMCDSEKNVTAEIWSYIEKVKRRYLHFGRICVSLFRGKDVFKSKESWNAANKYLGHRNILALWYKNEYCQFLFQLECSYVQDCLPPDSVTNKHKNNYYSLMTVDWMQCKEHNGGPVILSFRIAAKSI